jgi:hypothetical protein
MLSEFFGDKSITPERVGTQHFTNSLEKEQRNCCSLTSITATLFLVKRIN